jgi:hypothetical protein
MKQRARVASKAHMAQEQIKTVIQMPYTLFSEPEMKQAVEVAFSRQSFGERVAALDAICGAQTHLR